MAFFDYSFFFKNKDYCAKWEYEIAGFYLILNMVTTKHVGLVGIQKDIFFLNP